MKKYEFAENLIQNCQVRRAEAILLESSESSLASENWDDYVSSQVWLIRVLTELERSGEVLGIISEIEFALAQGELPMTSKILYMRAVCAGYLGQHKTAFEFCEQALDLATRETKNHKDALYALSGLVVCNMAFEKYGQALTLLQKMEIILEAEPNIEIKITALINKAKIFKATGNLVGAKQALLDAGYLIQSQKSLLNHIMLLITTGELHANQGNEGGARSFFEFAARLCDPEELPYRAGLIQTELKKLNAVDNASPDLKINFETLWVHEKTLGEVDFKNQFILFDLLKLFCKNRGEAISKSHIVDQIWQKSYDPVEHDNKIYVTIKRLRNLIEPQPEKPKYLFRSKHGYYLAGHQKTHIEMDGL